MGVTMNRAPGLIPDVGDLSLFARCNRHQLARIRSLAKKAVSGSCRSNAGCWRR